MDQVKSVRKPRQRLRGSGVGRRGIFACPMEQEKQPQREADTNDEIRAGLRRDWPNTEPSEYGSEEQAAGRGGKGQATGGLEPRNPAQAAHSGARKPN